MIGCQPEETAMVGDHVEWDVEGPLRAGYRLAVLVGGQPATLPPRGIQVRALSEVFDRLAGV